MMLLTTAIMTNMNDNKTTNSIYICAADTTDLLEDGFLSKDIKLCGSVLNCQCRTINGDWQYSSIDLNDCIANMNGVLTWGTGGDSIQSTKPPHLEGDALLCGNCRKIDGTYKQGGINLNEISNNDGKLRFNY